MRLCFVVDYSSPISRQWISWFPDRGHEVTVVSSYPVSDAPAGVHVVEVPLALSRISSRGFAGTTGATRPRTDTRRLVSSALPVLADLRRWAGPVEVLRHTSALRRAVQAARPDLVHAMRIPFEGMAAAPVCGPVPLVLSIWGNDLTLNAPANPLMGAATRRALGRASGLLADCQRDLELARTWGFRGAHDMLVPGNGGVRAEVFRPGPARPRAALGLPPSGQLLVNPRGLREYVRNDTFFAAVRLLRAEGRDIVVACPGMAGQGAAQALVDRNGLADCVVLLPRLAPESMADLLRAATLMVSPSSHDGTPNTLLEAMSVGALPVVGDLASTREWVTDGVNGLLCDERDEESLRRALALGLDDTDLQERARAHNVALTAEVASYALGMPRVERFYEAICRTVNA